MGFGVLSVNEQLAHTDSWLNDPRGVLPTRYKEFDRLLFRGGLSPGTFCILAGRQHTRKTAIGLNLISRWVEAGRIVGLVGLDELVPSYTLKLMSAMSGVAHENIGKLWNEDGGKSIRKQFQAITEGHFAESHGHRPRPKDLDVFLSEAEAITGKAIEVVVLDYISLMDKGKYGNAMSKMLDTIEALQVWTNEREVVLVALTHVGRDTEGIGKNEGHVPLAASGLLWGGENIADIVMGAYRPALDPVGNLEYEEAIELMPESWKDETKRRVWERAIDRVATYKDTTFLQLLKNRPGTKLDKKGVQLLSQGESMQMLTPLEKGQYKQEWHNEFV